MTAAPFQPGLPRKPTGLGLGQQRFARGSTASRASARQAVGLGASILWAASGCTAHDPSGGQQHAGGEDAADASPSLPQPLDAAVDPQRRSPAAEGGGHVAGRDEIGIIAGPFAELGAACGWLERETCARVMAAELEGTAALDDDGALSAENCTCEAKLVGATPDQRWGMLMTTSTPWPQEVSAHPVARTAAGWVIFDRVGDARNTRAGRVSEALTVRDTEALGPSTFGSEGAIFGLRKDASEISEAGCEAYDVSFELRFVCVQRGAGVGCLQPLLTTYSSSRRPAPGPDCDDERAEDLPHGAARVSGEFSAAIVFGPDRVDVTYVEGGRVEGTSGDFVLRAPAPGSYPYATLLPSLAANPAP